jgi:M6 family metalloprotease-like protein
MDISRTRLRAAVVTPTVLAGLLLSGLAGGITAAATATTATTTASAAAAPEAAGTASGFLFYVQEVPQPVCATASTIGLNASDDPAIDRLSCAFVSFTVAGATGDVTADLYAEGVADPFEEDLEAAFDSTDSTYQISFEPTADWPEGRIRMVLTDGAGPVAGEFSFLHNSLQGSVDAGPATAPNTSFAVTGDLVAHSARTTFGGDQPAAGATATVEVVDPSGTVLDSQPVTADSSGEFDVTVPAGATDQITEDTSLAVRVVDATYTDPGTLPGTATGDWASATAATTSHDIDIPATELVLENSFVSSVGWVKPGETYPSRIILTNPTAGPLTRTVDLTAPAGTTFVSATGPGTHPVAPTGFTWAPGALPAGESVTLVLESQAATTTAIDTIVWRDISSTAVLKDGSTTVATDLSHGPKVIPPSEKYDTARYGDRPFPVVPVQYVGRTYQADHDRDLDTVINAPDFDGSTFNLFQEMSLGQLFPHGTVPSNGLATADFTGTDVDEFTPRAVPGDTCTGGFTFADTPLAEEGTPLYPERVTDGVYNLPGNTEFYGADSGGTAIAGPGSIDSGCGSPGKLVRDAAVIADPEIDFSDFDTDKDGVVDFFMVVFAGCGGNGSSQLSVAGCDYPGLPYDNVWPHSSSLEFYYNDEATQLPGYTTNDQLKNLEGQPLWYTDDDYTEYTTTPGPDELKVFVRVGPYNVNPETAIDKASVISHEYGHSLGLPDFYSSDGTRETYGDWNLMATDKSQNMDIFSRQELGWVVPQVLEPGTSPAVDDWQDSKVDTDAITWRKPDGTPYTLTENTAGVGRVQNSEAYVAKLPGRQLLDPEVFNSGDGASQTHAWWSESGNDFGCNPTGGHNFDLLIPELASIPDTSTVTLQFQSNWDIEWEYDYGFVLTTTDGGQTYESSASLEGYTTAANDPTAPPMNSCQTTYDNGLTGTSGSYAAGTQLIDRNPAAPSYPPGVFLTDRYDISELAGQPLGALRFSYATDPGLARPGWFIDDVKVTVDEDGSGPLEPYDVLVTDFETSGGPDDERVYNGGCKEDLSTATQCTDGWNYVAAGAESPADHAYFLEMRDRSGFDFEGRGQIDRDPIGFTPGLSLVYTDESHGYGNNGTPDPPAQSPLDSVPVPGDPAPDLNDAAFVDAAGRSMFSDREATPHVSNYLDPESDSGNWEFGYDCLRFTVDSMTGEDTIQLAGDLVGDVSFDMGTGCGEFDYGYTPGAGGGPNTAPTAAAVALPSTVKAGEATTLSAAGSTDAETPDDLDYSWSFGDGGTIKDAEGKAVQATYSTPGTYTAKVTVTDPLGLSATATTTVTVLPAAPGGGATTPPKARIKLKTKKPDITRKVRLSGRKSTGTGPLTYAWNFHNGGKKIDATGKRVKIEFKRPGRKKVTLFVTDINGQRAKVTRKFRVRGIPAPASRNGMTRMSGTDDLASLFLW